MITTELYIDVCNIYFCIISSYLLTNIYITLIEYNYSITNFFALYFWNYQTKSNYSDQFIVCGTCTEDP